MSIWAKVRNHVVRFFKTLFKRNHRSHVRLWNICATSLKPLVKTALLCRCEDTDFHSHITAMVETPTGSHSLRRDLMTSTGSSLANCLSQQVRFFGLIQKTMPVVLKVKSQDPTKCVCVCGTWAISCTYGPKCSMVILGRQKDGITSVSAKSSPHVLVKKSDSRLASRGSFSAAGRLTLELKTVHLSCSATTDGPSHRPRPSPAEPGSMLTEYDRTEQIRNMENVPSASWGDVGQLHPPVGSLGQTSGSDRMGRQRGGEGSRSLWKIPSRPRWGRGEEPWLEAMASGLASREASCRQTDRQESS